MQLNTHIAELTAYIPGKPISEVIKELGITHVTKLASNENPWGCPVNAADLNDSIILGMVYPNLNHPQLISDLSAHYAIATEQLILGNGSDELLQLLALTFLNHATQSITGKHTFSVYRHVSQLVNSTCITVEMNQIGFCIESILSAVNPSTRLIFIANPNNPSGAFLKKDSLHELLKRLPDYVILVLDEAYREFVTDEDPNATLSLLKTHSNIVILRTFSKAYGLAAFRIGYLMGNADLVRILHKVRQPFNVNAIALTAAKQALTAKPFLEKTIQNNTQQRAWLSETLPSLGVSCLPSQANFMCIQTPFPAMDIYHRLLRKGYIIRPLDSFGLSNAIRVSIGTPHQNQGVVSALKTVLDEIKQSE